MSSFEGRSILTSHDFRIPFAKANQSSNISSVSGMTYMQISLQKADHIKLHISLWHSQKLMSIELIALPNEISDKPLTVVTNVIDTEMHRPYSSVEYPCARFIRSWSNGWPAVYCCEDSRKRKKGEKMASKYAGWI